jgi:hypothetical protein
LATADEPSVPLAVGPLASRTAGPVGPVLANLGTDLTPPVDRHERALLQEFDGNGADNRDGNITRALQLADLEAPGSTRVESPARSDGHQTDEPVVAVTGGGGFRLKVTGLGALPRAGSAALLAAMPKITVQDASPSVAASDQLHASLSDLALASESRADDRLEYTDYVRAAIGLAIGLGLATGPLFGDLIVAAPRRARMWLKALRSRTTAGSAAAAPKTRPGRVRLWAHRLVASR